jgi:hypothetical protein
MFMGGDKWTLKIKLIYCIGVFYYCAMKMFLEGIPT